MRFAHYDKEKERMSNKVRENQSGFSKWGVDRGLWKPQEPLTKWCDLGERSQLNGLARTGAVQLQPTFGLLVNPF
jgi:hypothetical protein